MSDENINPFQSSEYTPAIIEQAELKKYTSFPLSELTVMGIAAEPIVNAISSVAGTGKNVTAAGESGLYWVYTKPGTHLAKFADSRGYLGGLLSNANNQVGAGQAVLIPANLNTAPITPSMIFVACAVYALSQKLENCIQVGRNILQYLELKDKSEIIGSINFMTDVFNNYKLNWNNQRYIDSNLAESVSIRRRSEESIELQRNLIEKDLAEQVKTRNEKYVVDKYNSIVTHIKNYQLSLYMLSFSMFLEIVFNDNFSSEYLKKAIDKINKYSINYRILYTECYNYLKKIKDSSIEIKFKDGMAKLIRIVGDTVGTVPFISKSNLDKNFKEISKNIEHSNSLNSDNFMKEFTLLKSDYTKNIIKSIQEISEMFNGNIKLLFDKKNIYYLEG